MLTTNKDGLPQASNLEFLAAFVLSAKVTTYTPHLAKSGKYFLVGFGSDTTSIELADYYTPALVAALAKRGRVLTTGSLVSAIEEVEPGIIAKVKKLLEKREQRQNQAKKVELAQGLLNEAANLIRQAYTLVEGNEAARERLDAYLERVSQMQGRV